MREAITRRTMRSVRHRPSLTRTLVASAVLVFAGNESAVAQQAPAAATASAPEVAERQLELGTVVISGKRNPILAMPSSTVVKSGEEILDKSLLQQGVDILRNVPGLQVSTLNQGGFRERFVMRGFASAGESVAAFLDGVPLNESNGHGDGSIDLSTMIPEEIDRVEIVKGPFSALYGNFARAGTVNFITKNNVNENLATVSLGQWATRRTALTLGRKADNFSQYYAVEAYSSDGFRENSKTRRSNFAARWSLALSPDATLRFGGRNYSAKWDAPGYLTQADWDAGAWKQSNTKLDAGEKDRYDLNVNLNYRLTSGENIGVTAFRYSTDFHRWRQAEVGQPQTEEHNILDGTMLKLLYMKQGSFLTRRDTLLVGVDFLREDGIRRTWNNTTPYARSVLTADGNYRQDTTSAYTQLEMMPVERLGVVLGARYDRFDVGLNRKQIASGALNGSVDRFDNQLSAFSPKAGLSYGLSPSYEWFANVAKGFYLPTSFDKFTNADLAPVDLLSYESGIRFKPLDSVRGSIALFRIDSKGDVTRQGGPTGPLLNSGDIRRQGVEIELTANLPAGFRFVGSATHVDAEFRNYTVSGVDLSGKTPIETPPYFYQAALEYFSSAYNIGARFAVNGKGAVWLDNPNKFRYEAYTYMDAQLYYVWGPATLDLKIGNLTDRRYAEYSYAGTAQGSQRYAPARPRNAQISLRVAF